MDNSQWLPIIHTHKCIGCGSCSTHCPTKALAQRDDKANLIKPESCIYCASCESVCPQGAIELPYIICREPNQQGKVIS